MYYYPKREYEVLAEIYNKNFKLEALVVKNNRLGTIEQLEDNRLKRYLQNNVKNA